MDIRTVELEGVESRRVSQASRRCDGIGGVETISGIPVEMKGEIVS